MIIGGCEGTVVRAGDTSWTKGDPLAKKCGCDDSPAETILSIVTGCTAFLEICSLVSWVDGVCRTGALVTDKSSVSANRGVDSSARAVLSIITGCTAGLEAFGLISWAEAVFWTDLSVSGSSSTSMNCSGDSPADTIL